MKTLSNIAWNVAPWILVGAVWLGVVFGAYPAFPHPGKHCHVEQGCH